jgi:tetratricopeptide (TPR) repeat protein
LPQAQHKATSPTRKTLAPIIKKKKTTMLNRLFKKKEDDKKDTVIEFKDGSQMDFDIFWLQRELEFQHQNQKIQFRTNENHSLKFGAVVNSLFDIRKEELAVLTINDGSLTIIEGEGNIWDYEFLKHYKRDEKGEYSYYREGCSKLTNQIVLTLAYRTYDKSQSDQDKSISKKDAMLIVHLQYPEGLKDKVMYIQATFCLPTIKLERSKKGINPQPDYLSILIGYDYRPNEESTNEFLSVYNSAKEKLNNDKTSQMNYLEREILEVIFHPQIAKEFYFGKKVMSENRYWDAIEYFDNAFNALQQKWWKEQLSDEEFHTLIECSFLIGYCYYELGLFDKSYKYLEFSAKNSGDGYKYQSEYINCLIALHDIRALMIIDHHLEILTNKAEEERNNLDYEFYMFLSRRKAYCLIELGQYEQAEIYLKKILENDPENKFAKEEMEYINSLKNK